MTTGEGVRDDVVAQLREASQVMQGAAWRRVDGGQDLCLSAVLADKAADEIERLRERLAAAPPLASPPASADELPRGAHGFALPSVAALQEALRDHRCIVNDRTTVAECVDSGSCGCTTGLLLSDLSAPTPAQPADGAEELREKIAEALYGVGNKWIQGNFPPSWQPRPLSDDETAHRLHLAYADAILALIKPLLTAREEAERLTYERDDAAKENKMFRGLADERKRKLIAAEAREKAAIAENERLRLNLTDVKNRKRNTHDLYVAERARAQAAIAERDAALERVKVFEAEIKRLNYKYMNECHPPARSAKDEGGASS